MIQVKRLFKRFNGNIVLRGIDLDIPEQENLVILGPSGQGKTVFIKTLVGLLKPDSGIILYDNSNILKMAKKEFRKLQKKIAFVFQDSALFDFLTVRENLSLYLKMHTKLSNKEIIKEVIKSIHFVGLGQEVLDKYPEELSEGMKKRVAIARAMIQRPHYIFYDEPTMGLDEGNAEKVSELIILLKKVLSVTSIIVTHDINLMHEVSDRVALLKKGKIIFVGKKEEINKHILDSLYGIGDKSVK